MNFLRAVLTKKIDLYYKEKDEYKARRKEEEEKELSERKQKEREKREAYEKDIKENPCKYFPHEFELIQADVQEWTLTTWNGVTSNAGDGWKKAYGCKKCRNAFKFVRLNPDGYVVNWDYDVAKWQYRFVIENWSKRLEQKS